MIVKKNIGHIGLLINKSARLRLIHAGDIEQMRVWKNENKKSFFYQEDITPEQQKIWFEKYRERENDVMFVMEAGGFLARPLGLQGEILDENCAITGCIGYRIINEEIDLYNVMRSTTISFKLTARMSDAINILCNHLSKELPQYSITCRVVDTNPALDWYEKNGFKRVEHCDGYYKMLWTRGMISVFGSKVGEEEIAHVTDSINNQWMGMGPKVKEFEKKFSERLGLSNFLMVDSGSNALYLACKLLDLPPQSEIILPSFTWISCAHAIILAGHKPVFADVELDSYNISAETIEKQITSRTKAIMVVHYGGLPVEMLDLEDFGLPIIEDAAHAVDSKYNGKYCGGIGSIGVFSFDAIKNLAVGEGGGISTQSKELIARANTLRYCGIGKSGFEASTGGKKRWWEYRIDDVFIKMNPSDIAAGIGLGQLEHLDEMQRARKKVWDIYQSEFDKLSWLQRPLEAKWFKQDADQHSYFTYCIRVPKRDELAKYLFDKRIYTTLRYHPLHMNPIYNSNQRLPNCEQLNEDALSIPIHPSLTEAQVNYIVDSIKKFESQL